MPTFPPAASGAASTGHDQLTRTHESARPRPVDAKLPSGQLAGGGERSKEMYGPPPFCKDLMGVLFAVGASVSGLLLVRHDVGRAVMEMRASPAS